MRAPEHAVRAALAAVLVLVLNDDAHAAWPHDPFENIALCTAVGNQQNPVSVSDGAGGAIVVWRDGRGGNDDIYAQRVSAAGAPMWSADGVLLCTAANNQQQPEVVSDGAGGAIVTWHDYRTGPSADIYVQRVNSAGMPQWTSDGVALCVAAGSQWNPSIAEDGAGGAIVAWQDGRVAPDRIYAQRVSAAGAPQWTPDGVALRNLMEYYEYEPMIISDGAGGAIVTWYDNFPTVFAQRVSATGALQWNSDGVALCTAENLRQNLSIVSDGAGGAIVTWNDLRSGGFNWDIYAQRVSAAGEPQWTADGVALCLAAYSQYLPVSVSDGVGGAIVTWHDERCCFPDIYAQRVSAAGAPQWTADGVALCTAADTQYQPKIASDGAGGAIVTWSDLRSGGELDPEIDIYARRVTAAGVPQWIAEGAAICAPTIASNPSIVPDGAGGAIVTWQDQRSGNYDIYCQRVERFGQLGNPEPTLASVRDVLNDQGGKLRIAWNASYLDADPAYAIDEYRVWRSVPSGAAAQALAAGARLLGERAPTAEIEGRVLDTSIESGQTVYWEYVGSQVATGEPGYSYVVPTTSDSMAGSNPYTMVRVQAMHATSNAFWNSANDSGYSVDNIPPSAPAAFVASGEDGAVHLTWEASSEPDFDRYRLYRGDAPDFEPGPSSLIAEQSEIGFIDASAAENHYKLAAVDAHGNEGTYAAASLAGTVNVPAAAPRALQLSRPSPNPARLETVIGFTLPRAGPVTLEVYDAGGRRVRTLSRGWLDAGEHAVRFDLRGDGGPRLGSGLYFVRLGAEKRLLASPLVVVR